MNEWLIPMALSIVFQILKDSVKNPASKAKMRAAFLKLFNAIKSLYSGDPDFE